MKPEKINYPEICREIEKRVQKDAPRTHRLPLTKSSFAVNRVAKVYRSEVQELLKKCSKLDRMLIQRINPEAETQSDSTQSIDEIMSGLKSSRTESNDSEESASEESLARTRSRANTEESKSSNNTFPPNVEYSDDLSNLNDVTINDEEFSTESNPGINNDAGSRSTTKGITETASKVTKRTKRKSGSRKRTKTSLRTIGTQTAEDPQSSLTRQRVQETQLLSFPLGHLVVFDKNGTPCKLIITPINPNYFK
ncbi:uncharacterized protein LOC110997085 isoform X4 [Pieris rapae]|uniref:uncharacterized protein LOC110997085 isoform X4 n=1 Tax=Pieris rapae TaxID=64459 RepID=UPI001E27C590|nr:uncharacterized protein LOC110997085 isoform X4 [Pieris rapae]